MQEKKNDSAEIIRTLEELRMFIQDHRVYWEVLPEKIPVKEEAPLKIGCDLMLYGTHEEEEHPTPGCEKCMKIYRDLRRIANSIIPKEERHSRALRDKNPSYSEKRCVMPF